jgi:glucokinase
MTLEHPYVLALDLGGTKLASAVIDTAQSRMISCCQSPTPAEKGAAACIEAMFALGRQAISEAGGKTIARVGISFGGPVSSDRQTVLRSFHITGWEDILLPKLACEEFCCPAYMENDANAAALGAWGFDGHQNEDYMLYIQISTGVGAGFILNRKLYRGNTLAGELGHINVQPGGPQCSCGKAGCLESVCSGWALAREGRAALQPASPDSPLYQIATSTESPVDARMVFEAARAGDPSAKRIIKQAFTALGTVIANLICLFDPGMIVLGGGLMRSKDVFQPILAATLEREVHPLFKDRYQLRFSTLEGREPLFGASLLSD